MLAPNDTRVLVQRAETNLRTPLTSTPTMTEATQIGPCPNCRVSTGREDGDRYGITICTGTWLSVVELFPS